MRNTLLDIGLLAALLLAPLPVVAQEEIPALPEAMEIQWWNLEDGDLVSVGKEVTLRLSPEFALPATPLQEIAWNRQFPARLFLVSKEGAEYPVPVESHWLPAPYDARGPVRRIRPRARRLAAGRRYRIEVETGQDLVRTTFSVLPEVFFYKTVHTVLPADDCTTCWPHPVEVIVWLPPGYYSDEPGYDNRVSGVDNPDQRYPVIIGLHTLCANAGDAIWIPEMANKALRRGAAEPAILVLPTGTLNPVECLTEPMLAQFCCDPIFLGNMMPGDKFTSYTTFLADSLRAYVRTEFRVRGSQGGQVTDVDAYRTAHGLVGVSGGGTGTGINAHLRPDAYGVAYSMAGGGLSLYNPFAYPAVEEADWDEAYHKVCPDRFVPGQRQKYREGYRELYSLPDGLHYRQVHWEERSKPGGDVAICNYAPPIPLSPQDVQTYFWQGDITAAIDPEGAESNNYLLVAQEFPYRGYLYYSTSIFDKTSYPMSAQDLDNMLDLGGIPHTYRNEDRGTLVHDWGLVADQAFGEAVVWDSGEDRMKAGIYPRRGSAMPFLNACFEGLPAPVFNHPTLSEFTVGALDPDRDGHIEFSDPELPGHDHIEDNCPGVYNPEQKDSDYDGSGDACDPYPK